MTKENVSKMFLLPGLEIKDELIRRFNTFGFVNTYLTCQPLSYPYHVLFLLFKPGKLDIEFNNFVVSLQKNQNFIEVIDLADGRVLVVYKIPSKFNKDYGLFLEGKYSKLSAAFKSHFAMERYKVDKDGKPIKVYGQYVKEHSNFYHIFNRTKERRDMLREQLALDVDLVDTLEELYQVQDPEKETIDIQSDLW